jgi:hypothetical protein
MQWFFRFHSAANEEAVERPTCPAHSIPAIRAQVHARRPCAEIQIQPSIGLALPEEKTPSVEYMDFHEVRLAHGGTRVGT